MVINDENDSYISKKSSCCSNQVDEITELSISSAIHSEKLIYIDSNMCTGCGLCMEVCPFGLPKPNSDGKFIIDRTDLCIECSACQRNCPVGAILMQEQKGCGCLWDVRRREKENKCC